VTLVRCSQILRWIVGERSLRCRTPFYETHTSRPVGARWLQRLAEVLSTSSCGRTGQPISKSSGRNPPAPAGSFPASGGKLSSLRRISEKLSLLVRPCLRYFVTRKTQRKTPRALSAILRISQDDPEFGSGLDKITVFHYPYSSRRALT